jgi:hypothetical protein
MAPDPEAGSIVNRFAYHVVGVRGLGTYGRTGGAPSICLPRLQLQAELNVRLRAR